MKQHIVQITDEALQNMDEIYNYIAIELLAPDATMNLYNKIADEIMKLNFLPEKNKDYGLRTGRHQTNKKDAGRQLFDFLCNQRR